MKQGWRQRNRLHMGINLILSYLAVLVLLWLSLHGVFRFDVHESSVHRLSEGTITLLQEWSDPLEITILFQSEHPLYEDIVALMAEYALYASPLKITWIDPLKDRAATEKVAARYQLDQAQVIIVDQGQAYRVIQAADMMEVESITGEEHYRILTFLGEQKISSALRELSEGTRPIIYFVEGHGEHRLTQTSMGRGYASFAPLLEQHGLDARSLQLSGVQAIPSDAKAVVVAGPTRRISRGALEAIERYLHRNGKLYMLLDAQQQSGYAPLLRRWGVSMPEGIVMDPAHTLRGQEVNVQPFKGHEIGATLTGLVQLTLPRAIIPAPLTITDDNEVDRPRISVLMQSSQESWLENDPFDNIIQLDLNRGDLPGPIPLAVAVERGVPQTLDMQLGSSKLVVIGDADFVSNGNISGSNADLFLHTLDWLIDRDDFIDIPERKIKHVRVVLSEKTLKHTFWGYVCTPPILVLLIGGWVAIRRRR